jgi:hypothetical protein
MPESIKAMWAEFAAGLGSNIPKYEIGIVERSFVAGAISMFGLCVSGCMTREVVQEIMREIRTASDGQEAKDGSTHA